MQNLHVPGQRWISTSEPELGLGTLLEASLARVTIYFSAVEEKRTYALESAPVMRVKFRPGDEVLLKTGEEITITKISEENSLVTYHGEEGTYPEEMLDDSISFSNPDARLLNSQVDDLRTHNLRIESLFRSSQILQSPVRGMLGGRIDLIPHQISIVHEVSKRPAPRVLLADEVGLGKTIEACLIMHRLHLTGRADRVLIILPEALVHQWFVELLRRFNLIFAIFDEERAASISSENPFLENQLILCSQDFLLTNPERVPQVLEAGWDLLIVDEAHHLEWSPDDPSPEYELVEALAEMTPSILLLTATPQQLGTESHFARLRLLDPHRYHSLEEFLAESYSYEEVADAIELIESGGKPDAQFTIAENSPRISAGLANLDDPASRDQVVRDLLDSFGTGRVMFRHTRKQLSGFPERKANLIPLTGDDEFEVKAAWLVEFLAKDPKRKVLLICKTIDLVEDLTAAILDQVNLKIAQFHEELSLLQRDRNSAYFSEEDGANLLICSEIGSEGRNFQFAHHLVLFDLPENAELLEQRIGRLDRIGQSETIHLHVPYLEGSRGERYARWYHEGLNAFEKNLPGARVLVQKLQAIQSDSLDDFIAQSQILRAETEAQMERGPDRLLARTSSTDIDEVLGEIDRWDHDASFEDWVLRLFDHFGLSVEDLGQRGYLLHPGNVITDAFPDLPEDGMTVTFDRQRALSREEIGLMTADHPMVRSAVDLLLGSETGNSAFGVWEAQGPKAIILEACHLVECIAPASLQIDQYLPTTPIRVAVDHMGGNLTKNTALPRASLRRGAHQKLLGQPKLTSEILPMMLKSATTLAGQQRVQLIKNAVSKATSDYDAELKRLTDLSEVNQQIDEHEIEELLARRDQVIAAMKSARLRLDSLRLIYRSPPP